MSDKNKSSINFSSSTKTPTNDELEAIIQRMDQFEHTITLFSSSQKKDTIRQDEKVTDALRQMHKRINAERMKSEELIGYQKAYKSNVSLILASVAIFLALAINFLPVFSSSKDLGALNQRIESLTTRIETQKLINLELISTINSYKKKQGWAEDIPSVEEFSALVKALENSQKQYKDMSRRLAISEDQVNKTRNEVELLNIEKDSWKTSLPNGD